MLTASTFSFVKNSSRWDTFAHNTQPQTTLALTLKDSQLIFSYCMCIFYRGAKLTDAALHNNVRCWLGRFQLCSHFMFLYITLVVSARGETGKNQSSQPLQLRHKRAQTSHGPCWSWRQPGSTRLPLRGTGRPRSSVTINLSQPWQHVPQTGF